jgi:hypothetical protein
MQLAIHIYPTIKVFLGTDTKLLVLIENLSVEGIDGLELLIRRIFVPIYLIFDLALRRRNGNHTLNIEKFVPVHYQTVSINQTKPEVPTYVTVIEVVGKK